MLNKAIADIAANKAEAAAAAAEKDRAHAAELEHVAAVLNAKIDSATAELATKEANDVLALNDQLAFLTSSLDTQKKKQATDIATERTARTAGDASVASSLTTTINNAINQVKASLSSAVSSLSSRAANLEAFRTKVGCSQAVTHQVEEQPDLNLVDCL